MPRYKATSEKHRPLVVRFNADSIEQAKQRACLFFETDEGVQVYEDDTEPWRDA